MKRVLLRVLLVFAILGGIFLALLEWPQLVINPRVIGFGARHLARPLAGMDLNWVALRTEVESLSFFEKRVRLVFDGVCVESPEAQDALQSCFRSLDLAFAYQFRSGLPRLSEAGPVLAEGGESVVDLARLPRRQARDSESGILPESLKLPSWASEAELKTVDVRIERFRLKSEARAVDGDFRLKSRGKRLDLELKGRERKARGASGRLSAELWPDEAAGSERFRFRIEGRFRSLTLNSNLRTSGTIAPERIEGVLKQDFRLPSKSLPARAAGPKLWLSRGETRNCRYAYFRTDEADKQGKLQANCPVHVDLPEGTSSGFQAIARALQLERRAVVTVTADVDAPFPPDPERLHRGSIELQPGSSLGRLLQAAGTVKVNFALVPAKLPEVRELQSRVRLSAAVPRFERVVRELEGTPLAVPAPYQALRGELRAELEGNLGQEGGTLATRFHSRLASPNRTQRHSKESDGKLRIGLERKTLDLGLDLDVLLSDVRITLPKLAVAPPPQLFPDPRLAEPAVQKLLEEAEEEVRKIGLTYEVTVKTPPDRPVELGTELTEAPIPVRMDLAFRSPRKIEGEMVIEEFPVMVLGGRREIGQVRIQVDAQQREGLLMGEIKVQTRERILTPVPPPQLAGQAAGQESLSRVGPKFAVPATRILSSILLGIPLEEVSVEPNVAALAPETEERNQSAFLQFRRRY